MRKAAFLGVLALCQASGALAAFAQTSADIAASWGLLGQWQVQCHAPAKMDNPIYLFRARAAQVVLDRDFGTNRQDSQALVNVRPAPNGAITFLVPFPNTEPPQTREHVWVKAQDYSGIRVFTNRNPDTGEFFVRDGRFPDGATTPWFRRCS